MGKCGLCVTVTEMVGQHFFSSLSLLSLREKVESEGRERYTMNTHNEKVYYIKETHLLVVQDDVRKPNVFGWYMERFNLAVVFRIPSQFVVSPFLHR